MAARPIDESIVEAILAEWRTGAYSQRKLSDKHGVSKGKVGKICFGVEQDLKSIVGAGIEYKQGLTVHDGRIVGAINSVVDEKMKHLQFFTNAAVKNVAEAMEMKCLDQNEHRARADTILKGKEAVFGKDAQTVINNTNAQQSINPTRIEIVGV